MKQAASEGPLPRGAHDALCDLLAEEIWHAVIAATPAAVPDDVLLACLGDVVLRAAAQMAHRRRTSRQVIVAAFCHGITFANDQSGDQ